MKKPYDNFDSIPELKDLTPWDSIHLDKEFHNYLKSFTPDRVTVEPYDDRFAVWFGKEFAILIRVKTSNQVARTYDTNELIRPQYLVTDGALISNGIQTKEVLNANLKFKKGRRVPFDFRRGIYDVLKDTTIETIGGIGISTLYLATHARDGTPLTTEEIETLQERNRDNRNVPEPLIKVAERPLAGDRNKRR